MSGLASRNMHYRWDWQAQPKPGEVEYLAGCELRRTIPNMHNMPRWESPKPATWSAKRYAKS